jgi:hypothetical protein
MKRIVYMCLFIFFFFMVNSTFIFPVENASGEPATVQMIKFRDGEEEQFADVRPGNDNTVIFTGIINGNIFDDDDVSTITISLDAYINELTYSGSSYEVPDWVIDITPRVFEMYPWEFKEFNVEVTVPPGTSFYSRGELKVSGTATTSPDGVTHSINEITGVIRIMYYDDWNVYSPDISKVITRGDSVTFEVEILNRGNGNDVFFQTIDNVDKLKKNHIYADFPVNIELEEKAKETIEVRIDSSDSTPEGEYYIDFYSYPVDVEQVEELDNQFYRIKFKLVIEPVVYEKYFYHSVAITIIALILISVKIVRRTNRTTARTNDNR